MLHELHALMHAVFLSDIVRGYNVNNDLEIFYDWEVCLKPFELIW